MDKTKHYLIALAISILFAVSCTAWSVHNANKPMKVQRLEVYVVSTGETLWSIAEQYPHDNIRKFITDIEDRNNIKGFIHPGETLLIPVYESD